MSQSDPTIDIESPTKPRKRLFETGDMKVLVLHLIGQAPKFSYDIIKDISKMVGNGYSPSTGTIYPTLSYLEEQHFIRAKILADERKQYSITEQGEQHLVIKADQLDNIRNRFETRRKIQNQAEYLDIKRAMENLKTALRLKLEQGEVNPEIIREIATQIDQAAVEITRL